MNEQTLEKIAFSDCIQRGVIDAKIVNYDIDKGVAEIRFPESHEHTLAMIKILAPYQSNVEIGSEVKAVIGFYNLFERVFGVYNSNGILIAADYPELIQNHTINTIQKEKYLKK